MATMALVCTLSVFNGFQDLVSDLFTAFDPQLRITVTKGRTVSVTDSTLSRLKQLPEVGVLTPVLEDQALITHNGKQFVVTVKGVADNYTDQAHIEDLLYGDGAFILRGDSIDYGILGIRLASRLGVGVSFQAPIQIYAPKRGERVNMANPLSSFNHEELQSPGVVFMVQQAKYDAEYILTNLSFAQRLFDQENKITSLEVRLRDGVNEQQAKRKLQEFLGERFLIQDRYEQQEDVFRIMRVEKLISYVFLSFILLVACFNIIGSLSMLMIDKKTDVQTLRNLGSQDGDICKIFMYEGWLISIFGALAGILLGVLLCILQQTFGIITMGDSFIIEAYPVSVHVTDLFLVSGTVIIVSWVSVWYPVRYLSRNLLSR